MNSPKNVVVVGKTKLVYGMLHIPYDTYRATIGIEVNVLRTSRGAINVWDVAGMRDRYYIGADLFVIVCENEEQERKWRSRIPAGNIATFNPQKQDISHLLDVIYLLQIEL